MKDKKLFYKVCFFLIIFVGLAILFYPTVSNYLQVRSQKLEIIKHDAKVTSLKETEREEIKKKAKQHNEKKKNSTKLVADAFDDKKETEVENDGFYDYIAEMIGPVVATLEIDKLSLEVPIYQGTSEEVLQRGIGILESGSLPTGGTGTHTVLTGHRGLPQAKLFTDLPKLKLKDQFVIDFLDEKLAYEVDQIKTVEPEDLDALSIDPTKDYATLITCTPYMVNSHRLLVRGHRVPYIESKAKKAQNKQKQNQRMYLIVGAAVLIVLLLFLLYRRKRNKQAS